MVSRLINSYIVCWYRTVLVAQNDILKFHFVLIYHEQQRQLFCEHHRVPRLHLDARSRWSTTRICHSVIFDSVVSRRNSMGLCHHIFQYCGYLCSVNKPQNHLVGIASHGFPLLEDLAVIGIARLVIWGFPQQLYETDRWPLAMVPFTNAGTKT